jgi:hypothetical protein
MELGDTSTAIHSFNHPSTPLKTSRMAGISYVCTLVTNISSDDILSRFFFLAAMLMQVCLHVQSGRGCGVAVFLVSVMSNYMQIPFYWRASPYY